MALESLLPCFVCGASLRNALADQTNQPCEGTEFRTYGHYGSTVWDSFDGEELVLNICDACLRKHTDRLAQHKRYLPVKVGTLSGFGRQWVDRPMVAYTGHPDDASISLEPEDLGADLPRVEWAPNLTALIQHATRYHGLR